MVDTENMLLALKVLAAKHAAGLATQGPASSRLAALAGADVAPGRVVIDSVTGQPVTVVSAATVYLPQEALNVVS
jgi:hypothetical protein